MSSFFARLICCTFSWMLIASVGSAVISDSEKKSYLSAPKNIVAFFNVHAEGGHENGIVQNQVDTIKGSGLLEKLDNVYYATVGNDGKDYNIGDSDKYIHIAHHGDIDNGSELQTLNLLYQFCNANPASKVLYFHDKTSSHHAHLNATSHHSAVPDAIHHSPSSKFSAILNCYVLNTHCIDALDSHDTCGWRISPTPQTHYSGNYWWARCEYVNMLIDPMAPLNNQTFIEAAKSINQCVGIEVQNFAETWIGTGTTLLPADCMAADIDHSYVWGNHFPRVAEDYCHGPDKPSGHTCGTSSVFDVPVVFRKAIEKMNELIPEEECRSNRKEITKLSLMMYGEEPHTYLEWLDRLETTIAPPEGQLIRFSDSQQVYIVEQAVLRGIPNLKTFLTLGRDFSEVKVLQAHDKRHYYIGSMLPSV